MGTRGGGSDRQGCRCGAEEGGALPPDAEADGDDVLPPQSRRRPPLDCFEIVLILIIVTLLTATAAIAAGALG